MSKYPVASLIYGRHWEKTMAVVVALSQDRGLGLKVSKRGYICSTVHILLLSQ